MIHICPINVRFYRTDGTHSPYYAHFNLCQHHIHKIDELSRTATAMQIDQMGAPARFGVYQSGLAVPINPAELLRRIVVDTDGAVRYLVLRNHSPFLQTSRLERNDLDCLLNARTVSASIDIRGLDTTHPLIVLPEGDA